MGKDAGNATTGFRLETGTGVLPGIGSCVSLAAVFRDAWTALHNRYARRLRPLESHLSTVCEFVAVGIGLGLLGMALVACAIPILCLIPPHTP